MLINKLLHFKVDKDQRFEKTRKFYAYKRTWLIEWKIFVIILVAEFLSNVFISL